MYLCSHFGLNLFPYSSLSLGLIALNWTLTCKHVRGNTEKGSLKVGNVLKSFFVWES